MPKMLDPIFNDIYVAHDDDGQADAGKTSFPVFPDEKPTKAQLIKWLDTWTDDCN